MLKDSIQNNVTHKWRMLFFCLCALTLSHIGFAATCTYSPGDIGTIVGTGSDEYEAFSMAVEKCFDRRMALHRQSRGEPSEERGLAYIDSCANIRCQKQ